MQFRLIALALAALASSAAHATTTASVTSTDFGYVLKDLNAGDGVTPGLTWDANWSLGNYSSYAAQTGYAVKAYDWGNALEATYATAITANAWTNAPDAVLAGSAANGLGSFSVGVDATNKFSLAVQLSTEAGAQAWVSSQVGRGFWLTAGSQVTFSMTVDRELSGTAFTGSWTPPDGINSTPGHSWAYNGLYMSASTVSNNLGSSGSNGFTWSTDAYENYGEGDILKLTVRNTGASAQFYSLSVSASVQVQEQLVPSLPVPEPSSYALMALGLAGVGVAVRRRRRD